MTLVSTTALRYFAEVVRTGSIRGASQTLFVAASAISRQLGLLEDSLGAPVLERSQGRGKVKLTAAGELLMRYFRDLSNDSRRLRSEIEALRGLKRGHVSFGMPESLVRDLMPRFLASFAKTYPGISFGVQVAGSPRLAAMLLEDQIDACFTFGDFSLPDVSTVYSRLLPYQVLVPEGHPLEGRQTLRLSDCADYGLAMPDHTMSARRQYDEMLGKARVRARMTLETNSYELMRNVAGEGMCLSIVTLPIEDPLARPKAGTYVALKDPKAHPQLLSLCVHKRRNLPPSVNTFLAELVAKLEQLERNAGAPAAR